MRCVNIIMLCNVCGKELDPWDVNSGVEIHKTLGYGSLYDGKEVKVKMCCVCFDKLLIKCEVDPFVERDGD